MISLQDHSNDFCVTEAETLKRGTKQITVHGRGKAPEKFVGWRRYKSYRETFSKTPHFTQKSIKANIIFAVLKTYIYLADIKFSLF